MDKVGPIITAALNYSENTESFIKMNVCFSYKQQNGKCLNSALFASSIRKNKVCSDNYVHKSCFELTPLTDDTTNCYVRCLCPFNQEECRLIVFQDQQLEIDEFCDFDFA